MYKYTYRHLIKVDHSDNDSDKTILTATFSFKQETPPNQREEIEERSRLHQIHRKTSRKGPLHEFIMNVLDYRQDRSNGRYEGEYFGNREVLKITPHLFRLGFKLKSEASGYLPLEEMIDLEALNHFVLTGQYKQPEHDV